MGFLSGILSNSNFGGGNSAFDSNSQNLNRTDTNTTTTGADNGALVNTGEGDINYELNLSDSDAIEQAFDFSIEQSELNSRDFQSVLEYGDSLQSYQSDTIEGAFDIVSNSQDSILDVVDSAFDYAELNNATTIDLVNNLAEKSVQNANKTAESFSDKVARAYLDANDPDANVKTGALILAGVVTVAGLWAAIRR